MSDLSPERVRALQAWFASLTPQEAVRVRALVRNCGACVHFEPHGKGFETGTCCVAGPTLRDEDGTGSRWPVVRTERRCGRWNHPVLPLIWLSGLSPVELDQAARKMGSEVAYG